MSFFGDVDQIGVVERNIERLVGIEKSEAIKMAKIFKEGINRLEQELILSGQESFTQASIELALSQAELLLQGVQSDARTKVRSGSSIVTEQSVDDLNREVRRFSKEFEGISRAIPVDELLATLDSQNFLINRYETSLRTYGQSQRAIIQRELQQGILSPEPRNRTIRRIVDALNADLWKVLRIARTELHNIYNMTKNESMIDVRDSGLIPDLKKTLIHPMDSRTGEDSKLADRLDLVVDIDKPFSYTFKGEKRVFFAPPDRPNDRSILVPYRKGWDK